MTDEPQLGRLARLLPLAVLAGAICLFASELMTLFEFTPPGGEALCALDAGARHANAQMVIAVFAIFAVLVAVLAGSRPAAIAVAVMGVLALLIFLISDLRVANTTGSLSDACSATSQSFDAKAIPQGGFYLELVGALALAVTGIALATLTPAQLSSLRPPKRARPTGARGSEAAAQSVAAPATGARSKPPSASADEKKGRLSRLTRRPRARQRG